MEKMKKVTVEIPAYECPSCGGKIVIDADDITAYAVNEKGLSEKRPSRVYYREDETTVACPWCRKVCHI